MTDKENQEMREYLENSLEKNVRPVWMGLSQQLRDALVNAYKIGFEQGMLKGYHKAGLIIEETVIEDAQKKYNNDKRGN